MMEVFDVKMIHFLYVESEFSEHRRFQHRSSQVVCSCLPPVKGGGRTSQTDVFVREARSWHCGYLHVGHGLFVSAAWLDLCCQCNGKAQSKVELQSVLH